MPRKVSNPRNPYLEAHLELDGPPPPADLEVIEEPCKTPLSKNESPDIGFTWSLNPYRGCFHACAYCYARPTHQYLGYGAGTDFERRIVAKTNVAERLRETFMRPSWQGEGIAFSGNTDCYQPLESKLRLTRRCLETCAEFRNPVGVITKSVLVCRDIDVLQELADKARCGVIISIPFGDDEMARAIEPYAPSPTKRFEAVRTLAEAGLLVGVSLGPVIPGLNDSQIPNILERAADAGAELAFPIMVRLPREVLPVFNERLEEAFPLRAQKVRNAIKELRGGKMNEASFGTRMRGKGPRWQAIEQMFEKHRQRVGLDRSDTSRFGVFNQPTTFCRPTPQLSLF